MTLASRRLVKFYEPAASGEFTFKECKECGVKRFFPVGHNRCGHCREDGEYNPASMRRRQWWTYN